MPLPEHSASNRIRILAATSMSTLLLITILFFASTFLEVEITPYDPTADSPTPRLFGHGADVMLPAIGWSLGLTTVVLTWFAILTRNRRIQFEIPFWSGLAILCAVFRYSWVTHAGIIAWAYAGTFREGWSIWPAPLFSAFATFVGLLLIIWAVSRPYPDTFKTRTNRR